MKLIEFLNLFKQGKISAKSHMKNLLEMAMADGQFDNSEEQYLNKLARKYGISKKQLNEIHNDKDSIEFIIPEKEEEVFVQLFELTNMMVVDEDIDSEELKLCVLFAKKFGYKPENCEELVDSIASNIRNGQSVAETKRRINWLIN
ncbi:MAG: hypothetical protein OEY51_09420 [Cyclobacteriaceae bacterium]|nr:hypothetical protein [Cyclobacteriaceae bacterium]